MVSDFQLHITQRIMSGWDTNAFIDIITSVILIHSIVYELYKGSNPLYSYMNINSWNDFNAFYDQPPAKKKTRKRKKKTFKTEEVPQKKQVFKLTSLPVTTKVSEEEIPELMQAAKTPAEKKNSAQVVAEMTYFNRKNSDFW